MRDFRYARYVTDGAELIDFALARLQPCLSSRLCDAMPTSEPVAYCVINVWEEVAMRTLLVRSGFAGLIAASFLVGAPAAFAEMVMYKRHLTPAAEVPPTDSKAVAR